MRALVVSIGADTTRGAAKVTSKENDEVTSHGERHRTAEVLFHERQREIDPGCDASRGPHSTVAQC